MAKSKKLTLEQLFADKSVKQDNVIAVPAEVFQQHVGESDKVIAKVIGGMQSFVPKSLELAKDELVGIIEDGSDTATATFETGVEGVSIINTISKDDSSDSGVSVLSKISTEIDDDEHTAIYSSIHQHFVDAAEEEDEEK